MNKERRRYVFLDRDGVISRRRAGGQANCWEAFEFLPRSLEALRLLAANDYSAIVISRQTITEPGTQTAQELEVITRRILLEVAISEGHIAKVYYCRHRMGDGCNCYSQNSGLIARARAEYDLRIRETHFIGAAEFGLEAAAAAGCPCIRIQRDAFLQTTVPDEEPYKVASSLYEAAEQILKAAQTREQVYAAIQM